MNDRKLSALAAGRLAWIRPEVRRIQAGQAEVFTQTASDGTLTTS